MNDLLGILLPILLKGGDVGEIIAALTGYSQGGASGMDGLEQIVQKQYATARRARPLQLDDERINSRAESLVDKMGILPYSGLGQGATALVNGAYKVAPDVMGTVLGLPNPGKYFATVANGANAINQAAGGYSPDVLNPYSVMTRHNRAMDMAETVYNLGVNKEGGYNVGFTHGLDTEELGLTTQRLLSSKLAYREYHDNRATGELDLDRETGRTLDPERDAEEFERNLKQLGSKYNEAASVLSKVTGSVKEAISFMDQLAGGNALGGTARQASETASRAMSMASSIRVTAAMSGTTPQEAYARMQSLHGGMVTAMGIDPYIAKASGYGETLKQDAYEGMMAYNAFIATHPDATDEEKQQYALSMNSRAIGYVKSNGAKLANLVAANSDKFTKEELEDFESSYREGDPDRMREMVQRRLGTEMYDLGMNDEAGATAMRLKASRENKALVDRFNLAGKEGNIFQAERVGAKKVFGAAMRDVSDTINDARQNRSDSAARDALIEMARDKGVYDEKVEMMSLPELREHLLDSKVQSDEMSDVEQKARKDAVGEGNFFTDSKDAVLNEMRKMATENGADVSKMGEWSSDDIKDYLKRKGVDAEDIDRRERKAKVDAAGKNIDRLAITEDEEKEARERLSKEILDPASKSILSDEEKSSLVERISKGESLDAVFEDYQDSVKGGDRADVKKRVYGGKMSRTEAERERNRLKDIEKTVNPEYTAQDRMNAIEHDVKLREINPASAQLMGSVYESKANGLTDNETIDAFISQVRKLESQNRVYSDDKTEDMDKTMSAAAESMVSDVFGSSLGGLKGDDLKAFNRRVGNGILSGVKNHKSIGESFQDAVAFIGKDEDLSEDAIKKLDPEQMKLYEQLGVEGRKQLRKFAKDAGVQSSQATAVGSALRDAGMSEEQRKAWNDGMKAAEGWDMSAMSSLPTLSKEDLEKLPEAQRKFIESLSDDQKQKVSAGVQSSQASAVGLDAEHLLGYASSRVNKESDDKHQAALEEMKQLANGEFGQLSDQGADAPVQRFADLAKSIGIFNDESGNLNEESFNKFLDAGRGEGDAKTRIADMLEVARPKGMNVSSYLAAVAGQGQNGAALNDVHARAQSEGGGYRGLAKVQATKETQAVISHADQVEADRRQNNVANAMKTGTPEYYQAAVDQTAEEINNLKGALYGTTKDKDGNIKPNETPVIDRKTAEIAFGEAKGEDGEKAQAEARGKIETQLKTNEKTRSQVGHYMDLAETMFDKSTGQVGGVPGADILYNDAAQTKAMGSETAAEDLVDIQKATNRKEEGIGGFAGDAGLAIKKFCEWISDPSVKIRNNEVTVKNVR